MADSHSQPPQNLVIITGASNIESVNGSDMQVLNENGISISSSRGTKRHMQLRVVPRESQRGLSLSKKGAGEMRHTSFRQLDSMVEAVFRYNLYRSGLRAPVQIYLMLER